MLLAHEVLQPGLLELSGWQGAHEIKLRRVHIVWRIGWWTSYGGRWTSNGAAPPSCLVYQPLLFLIYTGAPPRAREATTRGYTIRKGLSPACKKEPPTAEGVNASGRVEALMRAPTARQKAKTPKHQITRRSRNYRLAHSRRFPAPPETVCRTPCTTPICSEPNTHGARTQEGRAFTGGIACRTACAVGRASHPHLRTHRRGALAGFVMIAALRVARQERVVRN
jgi:hypothetical protein